MKRDLAKVDVFDTCVEWSVQGNKSTKVSTWPCFLKIFITPLCFMKDLLQDLFLLTERNLKRNFSLKRKGVKQKWCSALIVHQPLKAARAALPSSLPRTTLSISASRLGSDCVWEHLGFVSIDSLSLLAKCILTYQKSLRKLIIMLSEKLDIIKPIWHDLIGHFLCLGTLKNISI